MGHTTVWLKNWTCQKYRGNIQSFIRQPSVKMINFSKFPPSYSPLSLSLYYLLLLFLLSSLLNNSIHFSQHHKTRHFWESRHSDCLLLRTQVHREKKQLKKETIWNPFRLISVLPHYMISYYVDDIAVLY